VYDPKQHESKSMTQFREDESLHQIRQQFFDGELPNHTLSSSGGRQQQQQQQQQKDFALLTPLERFYRIDNRLRRIVVKACENSYAASKVVNTLEEYLIRVHAGKTDKRTREEWLEFLLEPPTVTTPRRTKHNHDDAVNDESKKSTSLVTRFLFDADSPTGGFHRLLLHGLCQFHGLSAASSTMTVVVQGNDEVKKARVLTATGTFYGSDVHLVDFITSRQNNNTDGIIKKSLEKEATTTALATLKV
jgi:hypothetical protein